MNQEFEQGDLDTVDFFNVVCAACDIYARKCTTPQEDWADAIHEAKTQGFQIEDGVIYCAACAEIELQRQEEERIEEEGDDRYATRSDD